MKRFIITLLLLLAAFAMTACSRDDEKTPSETMGRDAIQLMLKFLDSGFLDQYDEFDIEALHWIELTIEGDYTETTDVLDLTLTYYYFELDFDWGEYTLVYLHTEGDSGPEGYLEEWSLVPGVHIFDDVHAFYNERVTLYETKNVAAEGISSYRFNHAMGTYSSAQVSEWMEAIHAYQGTVTFASPIEVLVINVGDDVDPLDLGVTADVKGEDATSTIYSSITTTKNLPVGIYHIVYYLKSSDQPEDMFILPVYITSDDVSIEEELVLIENLTITAHHVSDEGYLVMVGYSRFNEGMFNEAEENDFIRFILKYDFKTNTMSHNYSFDSEGGESYSSLIAYNEGYLVSGYYAESEEHGFQLSYFDHELNLIESTRYDSTKTALFSTQGMAKNELGQIGIIGFPYRNHEDAVILILDNDLNILNEYIASDNGTNYRSITSLESDFIVAGEVRDKDYEYARSNGNDQNGYVLRVNAEAGFVWTYEFDGIVRDLYHDIHVIDNRVYVFGSTNSYIDAYTSWRTSKPFATMLDLDGNHIKTKFLDSYNALSYTDATYHDGAFYVNASSQNQEIDELIDSARFNHMSVLDLDLNVMKEFTYSPYHDSVYTRLLVSYEEHLYLVYGKNYGIQGFNTGNIHATNPTTVYSVELFGINKLNVEFETD